MCFCSQFTKERLKLLNLLVSLAASGPHWRVSERAVTINTVRVEKLVGVLGLIRPIYLQESCEMIKRSQYWPKSLVWLKLISFSLIASLYLQIVWVQIFENLIFAFSLNPDDVYSEKLHLPEKNNTLKWFKLLIAFFIVITHYTRRRVNKTLVPKPVKIFNPDSF